MFANVCVACELTELHTYKVAHNDIRLQTMCVSIANFDRTSSYTLRVKDTPSFAGGYNSCMYNNYMEASISLKTEKQ